MRFVYYIGMLLQLVGLTAMPVALFVGVYGGDLGREWMIGAGGLVVFFAGTGLRSWAGMD